MTLRRHPDLERKFGRPSPPDGVAANGIPKGNLAVFSLDPGTPADCVIAAVEPGAGLLAKLHVMPALALSGVNLGQNMGNDVLYSGTFAAARQAAMYGIPALATSLDLFTPEPGNDEHASSIEKAIEATVRITDAALKAVPFPPPNAARHVLCAADVSGPNALREAFQRGDVVLNINVPVGWSGAFAMTCLDAVLYREAMDVRYAPTGVSGDEEETLEVMIGGAKGVKMWSKGSDTVATSKRGLASVTTVSTWPQPHPLAVSPSLLERAVGDGLPKWLDVGNVAEIAAKMT